MINSINHNHTLFSNLPIFVQLRERWRQLYHGWCEAGSMQCMFEMVHLKHIPMQLGHLAGLLDLFKGKMVSNKLYVIDNYCQSC